MKLPRDIGAQKLLRLLKPLGYEATRQSGSHIRLTTLQHGEHHITVPNHDPLKVGTLSAILSDVSEHFHISREELTKMIFQ